MRLKILSIVWDVKILEVSIVFWSEALYYELKREAEDDFAILVPKN